MGKNPKVWQCSMLMTLWGNKPSPAWIVGVKWSTPLEDVCQYLQNWKTHLLFESSNPTPGNLYSRYLCKSTYDQSYISQYSFVRTEVLQSPNRTSGDWLQTKNHKQTNEQKHKQVNKNYEISTYWNIMELLKQGYGIMVWISSNTCKILSVIKSKTYSSIYRTVLFCTKGGNVS